MGAKTKILVVSWLSKDIFLGKSSGGSEYRSFLLFNSNVILKNYDVTFFLKDLNSDILSVENKFSVKFVLNNLNLFKIILNFIKSIKNKKTIVFFSTSIITLVLFLISKLFNKKIVYFITCDGDVGVNRKFLPFYYYFIPFFLVNYSDIVIAQTKYQYNLISNKKKYLLNNPVIIENKKSATKNFVLWVGRDDPSKGLDILKKVIILLPKVKFKVIGLESNLNYPNVEFLGRVDYRKMNSYYASSKFLINTSYVEGFPNTFIQSFSNKRPVISYKINPDNILLKSKAGFCANSDLNLFVDKINYYYNSIQQINKMGLNGFNYVKKNHNIGLILNKLNKILGYI